MVRAGSAETGARCLFRTRRGEERHEGFGRCASAAMKGAETEVLRGNRSRWRGGRGRVVLSRWKGSGRGRSLEGSVRSAETERRWLVSKAAGQGGKAAASRINRLLLLPMDRIASLGCTVAEARDTNWEGCRYRGSLGGGTGIYCGVCRPRNHCPR